MTVTAGRTSPPTEDEVKDWLVKHYSHGEKMRRDRLTLLLDEKGTYAYLKPPSKPLLYRGLFNVTAQTLRKLEDKEETDEVKDKSWTTDKAMAWRFARGEFTDDEAKDGRFAVVITSSMPSDRALLNSSLTSKEPGIGDYYNEIWGETLEKGIRTEKEVLVSGSINVSKVESEPLESTTSAMKFNSRIYAWDDDEWYSASSGVEPRVDGDVLIIPIMDVIGDRWWGSSVSAKTIKKALQKHDKTKAKRIVLEINSPGGDVHEGIAIYSALRKDGRPIEAQIIGLAASMASVIMLAADTRVMLPGSMVMIHEAWTYAVGGPADMEKAREQLEMVCESILQIYTDRTGGNADVIRSAMREEKWLTADEAVNWGWAGEVVDGRDTSDAKARAPQALASNDEWNARRGALLASFNAAPECAQFGAPLGWTGYSPDELRAAMALHRVHNAPNLMAALEGVQRGGPTRPAEAQRPAASTPKGAPPELGTVRLEINLSEPARAQPSPSEVTNPPPTVQAFPEPTTKKKTMDEETLNALAASLDLPAGSSLDTIKAEIAANRARADKAKAEAEAHKALADQRERDRLTAEAQVALEKAQADQRLEQQAETQRAVLARLTFDNDVKALVKGLPPAFAAAMQKLCYRDDPKAPEGKAMNEPGFAAAKEAVAQMPQMHRDNYTAPNPDLAAATAASQTVTPPAGESSGISIFRAYPLIQPEAFHAHQAKLRNRAATKGHVKTHFTA